MEKMEIGSIEMEAKAFSFIEKPLKEVLTINNISADYLIFKPAKTDKALYSSVCLINEANIFCRISFRGKQSYFSVSAKYENVVKSSLEGIECVRDSNYIRVVINEPCEIIHYIPMLSRILEVWLDAYPTEFGCCSKYEECSDAKRCIHPDSETALRCIYRKNLKRGKIFYGKNRNV